MGDNKSTTRLARARLRNNALQELESHCIALNVLGSYPVANLS